MRRTGERWSYSRLSLCPTIPSLSVEGAVNKGDSREQCLQHCSELVISGPSSHQCVHPGSFRSSPHRRRVGHVGSRRSLLPARQIQVASPKVIVKRLIALVSSQVCGHGKSRCGWFVAEQGRQKLIYLMTIQCDDHRPGIVHAASTAIVGVDGNILENDQFTDPVSPIVSVCGPDSSPR